MHSTLNIGFILRLCSVVAILTAAVYGNGTSPNSTPVNANHDSHNTAKAIKSLEATLEKNFEKLIHAVNAVNAANAASGVGSGMEYEGSSSSFASCKDIYLNGKSKENRAYLLQMDSGKVPVFCHMTTHGTCGGGGWTLVMKIDTPYPIKSYI